MDIGYPEDRDEAEQRLQDVDTIQGISETADD